MKIGDRIQCIDGGNAGAIGWKSDRYMNKGEMGIILDIEGEVVKIKADKDGKILSRLSQFLIVIKPEINNIYEIY